MNILAKEQAKYEAIWQIPQYHDHTGGGKFFEDLFLKIVDPEPGTTVLDVGCGSGRGAAAARDAGFFPTLLDFVDVRDRDVMDLPFIKQPAWLPIKGYKPGRQMCWKYVICGDVMEHIPIQFTMLAIQNMLDVCDEVFFNISTVPDKGGRFIGETLHLTVRSFVWWRDCISEIAEIINARDLFIQGTFHVRKNS